ncbi:hypothetical protein [Flavivirga spongiicola]|uniref:Response regulator receiver domain-containing protein n=1 Tax=Flavivirga spongiicola TaxID=421621 RepID=A0ABU7XYU0_9FLAO|nr:hypothetical protein [Flavivirga sp. MEBiC05379]MDO5980570.1 hypothetical protein [Flavivirga sp. MEBiC05379]
MKKILVIEDEQNDFEMIQDTLDNNFDDLRIIKIPGPHLDQIKKGENISEYLNSNNYNLIIIDVGLIERYGLESDTTGKNLYNSFSESLKKITLFVSKIDANNLTREMSKKFFKKSSLETNKNFIKYVSKILSIDYAEPSKEQKDNRINGENIKISHFVVYSSLLLMLFVTIYTLIFLFFKVKYMIEGHYGTEDIVHFVESFFLVALPIFMSYAIFIFSKKIVGALADGKVPEKGTINDSVKIIGMVKNLFIGSIISYISLFLISNLFEPNIEINISRYLVGLGVIIVLVIYWKILAKH